MRVRTIMQLMFLLAIVAALAIGFGACDVEDAVKDQADTGFDEEEDLELEPIVVGDEGDEKAVQDDAVCGQTSVNAALQEALGDDFDDVSIDDVELISVKFRYKNVDWDDDAVDEIQCQLFLCSDEFDNCDDWADALIADFPVSKGDKEYSEADLEEGTLTFVNYYLTNRDEEFRYCIYDEAPPLGFFGEFYIEIRVRTKGEVEI
ncbi:hypothetical protein K8I61_05125 [bacterium]|nr:hypothetical protein [bacterium]